MLWHTPSAHIRMCMRNEDVSSSSVFCVCEWKIFLRRKSEKETDAGWYRGALWGRESRQQALTSVWEESYNILPSDAKPQTTSQMLLEMSGKCTFTLIRPRPSLPSHKNWSRIWCEKQFCNQCENATSDWIRPLGMRVRYEAGSKKHGVIIDQETYESFVKGGESSIWKRFLR